MDESENESTCAIVACERPAEIDVTRYNNEALTRRGLSLAAHYGHGLFESADKIWFCEECTKTYVFPLIDALQGNTVNQITADFKEAGVWG